MKQVYILTYVNINNDNRREIFGVYADEDSANDAMNDELFLQFVQGEPYAEKVVERLYEILQPEIESWVVQPISNFDLI